MMTTQAEKFANENLGNNGLDFGDDAAWSKLADITNATLHGAANDTIVYVFGDDSAIIEMPNAWDLRAKGCEAHCPDGIGCECTWRVADGILADKEWRDETLRSDDAVMAYAESIPVEISLDEAELVRKVCLDVVRREKDGEITSSREWHVIKKLFTDPIEDTDVVIEQIQWGVVNGDVVQIGNDYYAVSEESRDFWDDLIEHATECTATDCARCELTA